MAQGNGFGGNWVRCDASEADCLMLVQSIPFPAASAGAAVLPSAVATSAVNSSANPRPWEITDYENGAEYHDTSVNNNRLTVPETGLYRFIMSYGGSTTGIRFMELNGATLPLGVGGHFAPGAGQAPSAIIPLTAGDYMRIANGALWDAGSFSWFAVERIPDGTLYSKVGRTSGLALTGAAITYPAWQEPTGAVNTLGAYNSANPSRLTVPAGTLPIRLVVGVNLTTFAGKLTLAIRKNGTTIVWRQDVDYTQDHVHSFMTPAFDRVPGDYYEAYVNPQAACTLSADGRSFFSMEEVPATVKRCMLQLTSAKGIGSSAPLSFDSAVYDTHSMFNPVTPTRLTVPAGCTEARTLFCVHGTSTSSLTLSASTFGFTGIGPAGTFTTTVNDDAVVGVSAWVPVTPGQYTELSVTSTSVSTASTLTRFALECR